MTRKWTRPVTAAACPGPEASPPHIRWPDRGHVTRLSSLRNAPGEGRRRRGETADEKHHVEKEKIVNVCFAVGLHDAAIVGSRQTVVVGVPSAVEQSRRRGWGTGHLRTFAPRRHRLCPPPKRTGKSLGGTLRTCNWIRCLVWRPSGGGSLLGVTLACGEGGIMDAHAPTHPHPHASTWTNAQPKARQPPPKNPIPSETEKHTPPRAAWERRSSGVELGPPAGDTGDGQQGGDDPRDHGRCPQAPAKRRGGNTFGERGGKCGWDDSGDHCNPILVTP